MREPDPKLISAERDLLREVCKAANRAISPRMEKELERYSWRSPDHEVVFEALRRLERRHATPTPTLLSEEVTRMGFPDIDVSEYFSSPSEQTLHNENESQEIVMRLVAQLKSPTTPK